MLILKRIFRSPVLLIILFTVVVSLVFSTAAYLLYTDISKITTIMQHEIKQSSESTKQVYQDSASSLLQLVESISIDPLLNLEPVSLNQILLKVKQNPAVKSAFFLDAEEKVLADGSSADEIVLLGQNLPDEHRLDIDTNPPIRMIKGDSLIYSTPFEDQGDKIGRLQVVFSLDKIKKIETNLLEKSSRIAQEKQQRGFKIIVGTIIAIVSGMLLIITITRRLIHALNSVITKLDESSASVARVSDKISIDSQSLAEGSAEQTASAEQTSSSLEQISANTRQNADNALQADELVKNTDGIIHRASGSVVALDRSMSEINQASGEISKIIKTIDEIAFQTNLLALNAAVEAARAGQAGAGFAVVADEVRNLALRAAEAAKNTGHLIEGTVLKIKNGSKMVTETSSAFEEVAESSVKVAEIMSMIAVASNEQAHGIEQVNAAMGEVKKLARQTASHAERSAGASGQLISESQHLKNFVKELITLVSGSVANGRHGEKPMDSFKESSGGTSGLPVRKFDGPKNKEANTEPFVR